MGIRTIILLISLYILYRIIHNLLNKKQIIKKKDKQEDMIECKFCGAHTPLSMAIEHEKSYFCCKQHLENDQEKADKG